MGHDVPMERLMYEKCAAEVELLECIKVTFGKQAVEILEHFVELNEIGKEKAINTLIDLCMIEKYTEKNWCVTDVTDVTLTLYFLYFKVFQIIKFL